MSLFPIYSKSRAGGARSWSQSEISAFSGQNRVTGSWITTRLIAFLMFSAYPNAFADLAFSSRNWPFTFQLETSAIYSQTTKASRKLPVWQCKSLPRNLEHASINTDAHTHTHIYILSYWPLNFFGGLARSPASGWTTHLSSTNLEKQKLLYLLKHVCLHLCMLLANMSYLWYWNSHIFLI